MSPMPVVKRSVGDLAMFGGRAAFDEPIHVGRPNIGDRTRFQHRLDDMFDRRWLTNDGPYVQELERNVCQFLGVRHCVAMCNATVALEIAIRALELAGEVLVPSFTFVATAHALQWQQITPVFCDVDPATHRIDAGRLERMITPRTTGIIGVHTWGRGCDVAALGELARRHNLKLLFDAAHAFGCSIGARAIGCFGDAEVFSCHATKFFNSFEGGLVTTNNDELAAKMRLMRNFGFAGNDNVVYVGTNGKMTEVCAAMALTNLESLDDFIEVNRRNYLRYRSLLRLPGLRFVDYDERDRSNYQYVVLEVEPEAAGMTRDQLLEILVSENVLARRYFYPGCHRMEPYRSYFPHAGLLLPCTEALAARVLVLPNGTALDCNDVDTIAGLITFVLEHAGEIRHRLTHTVTSAARAEAVVSVGS